MRRLHKETHLVERIGWLRAAVLGANDGIISTAKSLILGVASAAASKSEVLLAGVAGLVAGAMSMAAGEYVSVSSQSDTEHADLEREKRELLEDPELRERGTCADLCRARFGASSCPRGCPTTDGQGCIGSACAQRARHFRNQHGTPSPSRPSFGCNLLSWSSSAPLYHAAFAPPFRWVRWSSWRYWDDRRKDRRRHDPSANYKGRFFGALSRWKSPRELVRSLEELFSRHSGFDVITERVVRRALIIIALLGLAAGFAAFVRGERALAHWIWGGATLPIVVALAASIARDLFRGRMGVDAIAFLSMIAALALGQTLAGIVVAIMYAGGTVLEDFAVTRAERSLKHLVNRAPRIAHRRADQSVEDVPVDDLKIGDAILIRAGEVIPIDGLITSASAVIDELALTGEPIPATRLEKDQVHSGTVNAGQAFSMKATATAGESTYAGIVRLVTAAQTAKSPFIRVADRYALLLLPITLEVACGAWFLTADPIRGLAVLVVATPCPLILAAPVAFIAGVSQAARRGILVKGGAALEALARTHTVLFDKTGTLTVGGARLIAVETAPGESADEVLGLAGSLEQASQHVVAAAIVSAATRKGLVLQLPELVQEAMGSGLEGVIAGRRVRATIDLRCS